MPIYEYACSACGAETEKLLRPGDPPLTDCPHCGHVGLKRKVSAPAFRLAGGGWYETDFKQNGRRLAGDGAESKDKKESGGHDKANGKGADTPKSETGKAQGKPEPAKATGANSA